MRWMLIFLLMGSVLTFPISAQDDSLFNDAVFVRLGEQVEGRLDNRTLRSVYAFEGRRGEFVTLTVNPVNGNLDPLLTVLDAAGNVLSAQDDGAGKGSRLDAVRIPRTDRYFVVVSRFGDVFGITNGGYELALERVGVSSESGSSLRYGDTIINTITDTAPQLYYSFRAQRGDILNIQLQRISGNLDPYLQIVDSNASVVASSDDVFGASTLDAAVQGFVVEESGTFVIIATRYGQAAGDTNGAFMLTLEETDNSGLGNTIATAADLDFNTPTEGDLSGGQFERFYTFYGQENDLIRVQMNRVSGSLDAYVSILDSNLRELIADDDGGGGQNAQIIEYRLPADGLYYVKATRFEGRSGQTVGRYRLQVDLLGGAFDAVAQNAQPILYGSTLTGTINDETPSVLYALYGNQGDVITVSVNRGDGNLDPVVNILGENLQLLVSDDDSGGNQNARIDRFVLSRTGVYYIEATRYSGSDGDDDTRGSYILVLAQRFD